VRSEKKKINIDPNNDKTISNFDINNNKIISNNNNNSLYNYNIYKKTNLNI